MKATEADRRATLASLHEKIDRMNLLQLFIFERYMDVIDFCFFVKDIPRRWAMWQAGKR